MRPALGDYCHAVLRSNQLKQSIFLHFGFFDLNKKQN